MALKKLDVENSDVYVEAEETIRYLTKLKIYYEKDQNFDELELGDIPIRDLFRFMSEHEFPKKGFIQPHERQEYAKKIEEEIQNIHNDLKNARLNEIKEKELNSIAILPSWAKVIDYQTKGFYLNKPVLEVKKDTVIMLTYDTLVVSDKFGNDLGVMLGPGIFYTEFSISQGTYVTNVREINAIVMPLEVMQRLLDAPPIFQSDIDATMNELINIIPFSLIEEGATVQAILKGVISRNIFLPNKSAIDAFMAQLEDDKTFSPKEGFKMMSAHPEYFNRMLLSIPPPQAKGDSSFNITSAGIASIIVDRSILDEVIPEEKEQDRLLLQFKDLKLEFNKTGKSLISDFMPR